jgi:D-sedoheptulose 7-phosphate isomerase
MKNHIKQMLEDFPQLEPCGEDIQLAFESLVSCFSCGGKLLLAGNGGSAADCGHWAGELLKSFRNPRKPGASDAEKLGPELAGKLQGGLPAIELPSLVSFSTAWNNDCDPQFVFAQGVWALGAEGDILVALSTSGNSANVIRAAQAAGARGMKVIGLTGKGGGKLAALCDISIQVPESEVYRVQQLHLPVYHCLCMMLEDEFFPDNT